MTTKDGMALTRLKIRKDDLLKKHGPRSPLDAKISDLIDDYRAIDTTEEAARLQAHFDLCDLYLARSDILSALTELSHASESDPERATSKAAEIMSRIQTKKFTRATKQYLPEDIHQRVSKITDNAEDGFFRNRLQVFFSIYRRDFIRALTLSEANIQSNPSLGVSDFITIARSLLQRTNYKKFLPDIGRIINDHFQTIADHEGQPFIQELLERYRNDKAALEACALNHQSTTSLESFAKQCKTSELVHFINSRDTLLFADTLTEMEKNHLIDELDRRFASDTILAQRNILVLIQRASCTLRFWDDPVWRDDFLSRLRRRLRNDPDHHGAMALGIISYLKGDDGSAETYFSQCIEGDSPFAETGATSFLSSIHSTPMAEQLLETSMITLEDHDIKEKAIVTCSDEIYFRRYAISYLKSLRKTGSDCPVHFHVAGNKALLSDFISTIEGYGAVSFSYETPPVNQPAYYASMRFLKAPYFLEKIAGCILLTDIDVAFRRDPGDLIEQCIASKSDVMFRVYDTVRIVNQVGGLGRPLYRYPRTYPWAHVNAACLCLTGSNMGKYSASQIARDMADHLASVLARGKRAWWVDQNSLLFTYRTLLSNSAINIGNIEDFGLPYGSFDYSNMRVVGGASPSLTPKIGRRVSGNKMREALRTFVSVGITKIRRLLRL